MRFPAKLAIIATVAAMTLGFMALDRTHFTVEETDAPASAPEAKLAPDVTFRLLEGGEIPLRSLSGHPVWLHFFASWCAPCRKEFSVLLRRIEKSNDGTILLAVSGDADAQNVKRFLAPYRHDFKPLFDNGRVMIAFDPGRALTEGVFQTFQYPETSVIGPDLVMRKKIADAYKGE